MTGKDLTSLEREELKSKLKQSCLATILCIFMVSIKAWLVLTISVGLQYLKDSNNNQILLKVRKQSLPRNIMKHHLVLPHYCQTYRIKQWCTSLDQCIPAHNHIPERNPSPALCIVSNHQEEHWPLKVKRRTCSTQYVGIDPCCKKKLQNLTLLWSLKKGASERHFKT